MSSTPGRRLRSGGRRTGTPRDPATLVRDTFRRRAAQALEHLARSASLETLAEALAAPTDFGAVARALSDPEAVAPVLPLDPLTDAFARGAMVREQLAAESGGLLTAEDVSRRLGGISRQAVDKRRRNHQVLGVRVGNDWRYPAVQFEPDGGVVPGLPAILRTLGDLAPWVVLDFLLAPDDVLSGATALAALRQGGVQADYVRRLADARCMGDGFS